MPQASNGQMSNNQTEQSLPLHQVVQMLNPNNTDLKHQSHNLTQAEMRDLKTLQALGEKKLIRANVNPDVLINEYEKHLIHVTLENTMFDEKTGVRKSKPRLQKFYIDDFEKMSRTTIVHNENKPFDYAENAFGAYELKIVHDPRRKEPATMTASKKVSEMTEEELRINYKQLSGDESDPADTKEMLVILVTELLEKK